MAVELLYFDDCPNRRQTADLLDELSAELAFTLSAGLVTTPATTRHRVDQHLLRVHGVDGATSSIHVPVSASNAHTSSVAAQWSVGSGSVLALPPPTRMRSFTGS
jgi:hypothetical protein